MKQMCKTMLALLLALVMVLPTATPAFAYTHGQVVEDDGTEESSSIIIDEENGVIYPAAGTVVEEDDSPLPFPKYDWDEAAESIREIGRIINSIAAHANRGGYVEVDGLRECAEEFDKVFRPLEAIANSMPPPEKRKLARIDDRFANKKYFHVRCTETEKNLVRLKAGYTSMSISGYVRAVLLGNSPNQKPPAGVHEIRRQVCSILNSLDQLVWFSKRANHPYWIKGTVPIAEDVRTRYHDFMNKIYYR